MNLDWAKAAAARALLDATPEWDCTAWDGLGHPPHSESCGWIVVIPVSEESE